MLEDHDILPAETIAWAFIDRHQSCVEMHAQLTDLIRRARNDTANGAYRIAEMRATNLRKKAQAVKSPSKQSWFERAIEARCIADRILADLVSHDTPTLTSNDT